MFKTLRMAQNNLINKMNAELSPLRGPGSSPFDIFFVYDQEDDYAVKYADNTIRLLRNWLGNVRIVRPDIELLYLRQKDKIMRHGIDGSKYVFVLLTEGFTDPRHRNRVLKNLGLDQSLLDRTMEAAMKAEKLIPLFPMSKADALKIDGYSLPCGLSEIQGIRIHQLVSGSKNKDLASINPEISKQHINPHILDQILNLMKDDPLSKIPDAEMNEPRFDLTLDIDYGAPEGIDMYMHSQDCIVTNPSGDGPRKKGNRNPIDGKSHNGAVDSPGTSVGLNFIAKKSSQDITNPKENPIITIGDAEINKAKFELPVDAHCGAVEDMAMDMLSQDCFVTYPRVDRNEGNQVKSWPHDYPAESTGNSMDLDFIVKESSDKITDDSNAEVCITSSAEQVDQLKRKKKKKKKKKKKTPKKNRKNRKDRLENDAISHSYPHPLVEQEVEDERATASSSAPLTGTSDSGSNQHPEPEETARHTSLCSQPSLTMGPTRFCQACAGSLVLSFKGGTGENCGVQAGTSCIPGADTQEREQPPEKTSANDESDSEEVISLNLLSRVSTGTQLGHEVEDESVSFGSSAPLTGGASHSGSDHQRESEEPARHPSLCSQPSLAMTRNYLCQEADGSVALSFQGGVGEECGVQAGVDCVLGAEAEETNFCSVDDGLLHVRTPANDITDMKLMEDEGSVVSEVISLNMLSQVSTGTQIGQEVEDESVPVMSSAVVQAQCSSLPPDVRTAHREPGRSGYIYIYLQLDRVRKCMEDLQLEMNILKYLTC